MEVINYVAIIVSQISFSFVSDVFGSHKSFDIFIDLNLSNFLMGSTTYDLLRKKRLSHPKTMKIFSTFY